MTNSIILQHGSGVKRAVDVYSARRYLNRRNEVKPNLEVHWPVAGTYIFDIYANNLLLSPRGGRTVWSAEDIINVYGVWLRMCSGPLKELVKLIPNEYRDSGPIVAAIAIRNGKRAA